MKQALSENREARRFLVLAWPDQNFLHHLTIIPREQHGSTRRLMVLELGLHGRSEGCISSSADNSTDHFGGVGPAGEHAEKTGLDGLRSSKAVEAFGAETLDEVLDVSHKLRRTKQLPKQWHLGEQVRTPHVRL
eukprot:4943274-Prymnesium_polylepis.3